MPFNSYNIEKTVNVEIEIRYTGYEHDPSEFENIIFKGDRSLANIEFITKAIQEYQDDLNRKIQKQDIETWRKNLVNVHIVNISDGNRYFEKDNTVYDENAMGYYSQLAALHKLYEGREEFWPCEHSRRIKENPLPDDLRSFNPTIWVKRKVETQAACEHDEDEFCDHPMLDENGFERIGYMCYYEERNKTFEEFYNDIHQYDNKPKKKKFKFTTKKKNING